nr:cation diffusion facilitator family transporter [uncultured Sellimonas sp.]
MTEFLVRWFVKNYEQTETVAVRTAYGVLASVVGILCNVFLFFVKGAVGIILHSISVTADAFNNLSDAGSSIIGLVGVKMAEKPADEEHPFGHGRIEYIAALIVAFIVLQVGFTFLKDAIGRIRNPEILTFNTVSVLILILSIGVKVWMAAFNRKLGKRIDSKVMMATAADAMGDVATTTATILSVLFFRVTGINIDGFVGIGVALVVMWAGIGIAKDTLEPLIGEAVPQETFDEITKFVESYDGIVGTHDLLVHNYGPGRSMASIHAEVPNDVNIEVSHEIIDRIEREARKYLGIYLLIHMDPIETKDQDVIEIREKVEHIVAETDPEASIHDFRMVPGEHQINLIFDMVMPHGYDKEEENALLHLVMEKIRHLDERYQCVITMEKSYVAESKEK